MRQDVDLPAFDHRAKSALPFLKFNLVAAAHGAGVNLTPSVAIACVRFRNRGVGSKEK
jgi:hypothetical protein